MTYTVSTHVDVETIDNNIEEAGEKVGFNILNSYKINRVMEDNGCAIVKEITIVEFCHPHGVEQALAHLPEISVYLPTKISFYEVNGYAQLSTMNLSAFSDYPYADEQFKSFMTILFENVKRVMHNWDK